MIEKQTFNDFGKVYQEKVVQAIISDEDFAQQILEVLDIDYFEQKFLKCILSEFFEYYKKYNSFPSLQILASILAKNLTDNDAPILKSQIKDYLITINKTPLNGDERYVKESALEFCKKQSLKAALLRSVDMIQQSKYEQVATLIKDALGRGSPKDFGHDYIEDFEKRHSQMESRITVPTGWNLIDRTGVLNGGLAQGELGTVMGVAGSGKSFFLVHLGAAALQKGFNVLHYTFELSENNIGLRYDACLTQTSLNEPDRLKKSAEQYVKELKSRLYIKAYPTKSATIQTLKNHIKTLEVKNFKPDLIIVDYADIMKSIHGYESKRFELESIYEDLRGLAQELKVPIWSVSQTNRLASNEKIVDIDTIGESFAKVQIADVVLTFSRTREDKKKKTARIFLAKNRIGQDGIVYQAMIDTEFAKIELLHELTDEDIDIEDDEEEIEIKKSIQKKWEQFKFNNTGEEK